MNSLEQAIAGWRQQMLAAGIKRAEVLDELESHLREDVERRIQFGVGENDAFQKAIQQIGQLERLKAEFATVESDEMKYMKRALIIFAGIIGIMVGMGFVTPAVAQYRNEGVMRNAEPWLFLLGSVLTLAGGAVAIRGMIKRRA